MEFLTPLGQIGVHEVGDFRVGREDFVHVVVQGVPIFGELERAGEIERQLALRFLAQGAYSSNFGLFSA